MSEASELRWSEEEAARIVRETYGAVVPEGSSAVAESLYDASELAELPNPVKAMALGLGNPVRIANLHPARPSSTWAAAEGSTPCSRPGAWAHEAGPSGSI